MRARTCRSLLLTLAGWMMLQAAGAAGSPSVPVADNTVLLYTFENLAPADEATRQLYGFDSRTAGILADGSGHGHTANAILMDTNSVVAGRFGRALRFNGEDQHLVAGSTTGLGFQQNDFTIEVWFRPAGDGTLCSMLSDTTSSFGRYQMLLDKQIPVLAYRFAGGPSYGRVSADEPLMSNRWHHVAGTFDHAAGQVTLYVDGRLAGRAPWNGLTWGSPGQAFYVGAHLAGKPTSFFKGEIDEIRISSGRLSPETILDRWLAPLQAAQAASAWAGTRLLGFAVPPVSATRWLPGVLPPEERITNILHVSGAKDTFEPASFILYPFAPVDKLKVTWTKLVGTAPGAEIPAESLNVRLVKRWYQSGNAWVGYPLQDTSRRVLVPELLVNDPELVRVDHEKRENYLRLDTPEGASYEWISYPEAGQVRKTFSVPHVGQMDFNHAVAPVNDAATLQPVSLAAGEARQFWVTVRLPGTAPAGTYTGTITLTADGNPAGAFILHAEVLPFNLPPPATYYDTGKPFHVIGTHHARMIVWRALFAQAGQTNVDARITQRLQREFENMRAHNLSHPSGPVYPQPDEETFLAELRMRKAAGLPLDPVFGGTHAVVDGWWNLLKDRTGYDEKFDSFKKRIDRVFAMVEEVAGHRNIIFDAIDEGQQEQLEIQSDAWRYIHEKGGRIGATGWDLNFRLAAHSQDYHCWSGKPTRERSALWHAVGAIVGSYAYPFSGPENPLLWRRNQGLVHYKANYDATLLYAYYEGAPNIWNDFIKSKSYRNFCMVYPTRDGVIDTIAWEGFREGIDDIRYATLLKQLAERAVRSATLDSGEAGKRALAWLELLDAERADLDDARREMVGWILKLRALPGMENDRPGKPTARPGLR